MSVTLSGSGQVPVQVKQTFLPTTFSTTSISYTDVTGLSVSITPTSASNKILVMVNLVGSASTATAGVLFALTRNGTYVGNGTASGNKSGAIGSGTNSQTASTVATGSVYLDSPATTSACTYQVKMVVQSGYTGTLGYAPSEGDSYFYGRFPASITVMEVSG